MHRLGYRTVERLVSVIFFIYMFYIAHIFCLFFKLKISNFNFFKTFEYINIKQVSHAQNRDKNRREIRLSLGMHFVQSL